MTGQTTTAIFAHWYLGVAGNRPKRPPQLFTCSYILFVENRQIRDFSHYYPIFRQVSKFRCSGNVTPLPVVHGILQKHMRT
jgi:hypothetical protein